MVTVVTMNAKNYGGVNISWFGHPTKRKGSVILYYAIDTKLSWGWLS